MPSVRSVGAATSGTTTTFVTFNKPAGLADGDWLYIPVINRGALVAPTIPDVTFTLWIDQPAADYWGGIYRKKITSAVLEPSTYTFAGFTDSCTGFAAAIQDADGTTPENVAAAVRVNTGSATGTAGLTTTVDNCLIMSISATMDNQLSSAWVCATDPATLTEIADSLSSGGNDCAVSGAAAVKTTAGATGASSYTLAGTRDNIGFLLAFQPPTGGGGVNASAEVAAASGTANNVTAQVSVHAEVASASGTAYDATVSSAIEVDANAEAAGSTGTAYPAVPSIATPAGSPEATGTAYNPTTRVQPGAQAATASGIAYDASTAVTNASGSAGATGVANPATPSIQVFAQVASASGAALDATVSSAPRVDVNAELASGTGTAYGPTPSVQVFAEVASATGVAFNPAAGAVYNAFAECATATGSANGPSPRVSPVGATALGTAGAFGSPASSTSAEVASATGTAFDPSAQRAKVVSGGVAEATGFAYDASVEIAGGNVYAMAGVAVGVGTAFDAGVTAVSAPTKQGGWYTYMTILREAAWEAEMEKNTPPSACPDCGEPLRPGPAGQLYCSFDGWPNN